MGVIKRRQMDGLRPAGSSSAQPSAHDVAMADARPSVSQASASRLDADGLPDPATLMASLGDLVAPEYAAGPETLDLDLSSLDPGGLLAGDALGGSLPVAAERRRAEERRKSGYRRVEDRQLISKAYEEANAIRENAYQEGFEQGMLQAAQAIDELRQAMVNLNQARQQALLSASDDLIPMALQIAEKILRTEVACDPHLVLALVEDTVMKAGRNQKSIQIKVNPADGAVVKQWLKQSDAFSRDSEVVVVEEPAVDAGSCIIETGSGQIDASFSTQLQILRRLFGLSGGLM
jgi:flagellar assembly protein FliH